MNSHRNMVKKEDNLPYKNNLIEETIFIKKNKLKEIHFNPIQFGI